MPMRTGRHAAQNVVDDGLGLLAARVVAGHDHLVGTGLGNAAHQRALAGIAVAATAKHAPQLAAALRSQRAQRLQGLVQRIGGVGVIDGHQRRTGLADLLHAPGHCCQHRAGLCSLLQAGSQHAQAGHHLQQVEHVVLANHLAVQGHGSGFGARLYNLEHQTTFARADGLGRQTGLAGLIHGDSPQIQRATGQGCRQCRAPGVVQVDHSRLKAGPVEQRFLGGPVGIHAAVVVQMVLGEIRENGQPYARAGQAVLGNADGRGLDRASAIAGIGKAAEGALQQHRIRGGHAGHIELVRRNAHAQGADHRAAPVRQHTSFAEMAHRLGQPPADAGLAIGTCHGQHIELLAGLAKPGAGHRASGSLQIGHRSNGHALQIKLFQASLLDQAGGRAALHGLGHIGPAVVDAAGPGDKGVARLHLAAVGVQGAATHTLAQPLHGRGGACDRGHAGGVVGGGAHSGSSTSLATICGLTDISGCTPIRRRVCCTTSLNTGPATVPP